MKRFLTILSISLLCCFAITSCEQTEDDTIVLAEYMGSVQTTIQPNPFAPAGFNIYFALYNNLTCVVRTGIILEDNYTLDLVRFSTYRYTATEDGFKIVDGGGTDVAVATYCGPTTAPQSEIMLDWDYICEEWYEYADKYGWTKPCHMYSRSL